MENPIIGSLLIIIGAISYWLMSIMDFKDEFSDSTKFRGYSASVIFIILGIYILSKLLLFGLAGFILLICSSGLLIYGIKTNRIGTSFNSLKPSLVIFIILTFIISLVLFLGKSVTL
ncbi:MAG: hypothetical protein KGZ90_06895 [Algoriphagus sp.]|nr:hypothetical protein [Algoriphagus sp.]